MRHARHRDPSRVRARGDRRRRDRVRRLGGGLSEGRRGGLAAARRDLPTGVSRASPGALLEGGHGRRLRARLRGGRAVSEYLEANRRLWDEWVDVNAGSELYRLEEFKQGASKLTPFIVDEVGDVNGKSLLHLQCHFGMDTLSWARLGAHVTGIDFSPRAVEVARG